MPLDSGELTVWRGKNTAPPGGMPRMEYREIFCGCYERRTVGVTRHYAAKRHGDRADALVRIQRTYRLSAAEDRVTLAPYDHEDTGAYRITQIQHVEDGDGLPATDLTLERDKKIDAEAFAGAAGHPV